VVIADAIEPARKTIRQQNDFAGGDRVLTATAASDEMQRAGCILHDLRRAQPNISLSRIADPMPIQH